MRTVSFSKALSKTRGIASLLVLLVLVGGCNIEEQVVSRQSGDKFVGEITSLSEFDRVTREYITPLDKLPAETLREFRTSLSFKNGGLAGFKYTGIKSSLSEVDYIKVVSLFGIKAPLTTKNARLAAGLANSIEQEGDPLIGYYCFEKGTCKKKDDYACTSNC